MRRPIFFHNHSNEDVISAIRALPAPTPKVQLRPSLVEEITEALGIASPLDTTVLLLRPEFVKRPPSVAPARAKLAAPVSAAVALLTTLAFALATGAILPH